MGQVLGFNLQPPQPLGGWRDGAESFYPLITCLASLAWPVPPWKRLSLCRECPRASEALCRELGAKTRRTLGSMTAGAMGYVVVIKL